MKSILFLVLAVILAILFGVFYNFETVFLIQGLKDIQVEGTEKILEGYYTKIAFTSIWFFILEIAIFLAIKLGIKKREF